jgi:hypothetical protein
MNRAMEASIQHAREVVNHSQSWVQVAINQALDQIKHYPSVIENTRRANKTELHPTLSALWRLYNILLAKPEGEVEAVQLMEVAFAVSSLMLEDLPKGTTSEELAKILTDQGSYQCPLFFCCPTVYHMIRDTLNPAQKNCCRALYNDYCDRVRQFVPEDVLRASDQRFVNWIQKDNDDESFVSNPDTQPTIPIEFIAQNV